MKKDIQIDHDGGPVKVNVSITGLVAAGYSLKVFPPASNNPVAQFSGTNHYSGDDNFRLPGTAADNLGRIAVLITSFQGINDDLEDQTCTITLEVFQDGLKIDEAKDVQDVTMTVQTSMILIKFI